MAASGCSVLYFVLDVNVTLRNDCEKLCCGNSLSNMYNVTLSCDNTVSKEVCECAAKKKNITLNRSSYESKPCKDCDCSSGKYLSNLEVNSVNRSTGEVALGLPKRSFPEKNYKFLRKVTVIEFFLMNFWA